MSNITNTHIYIISNCGTATYEISKYLAEILLPLTKNEFTINNTLDFVSRLKSLSVKNDEKMVSFDVSSLFSNVPLDFTIDVILKRIYVDKSISIKLKREELKSLLELCTKQLHFSFNGEMYQQRDGVAMGSPLGPVIANIFMTELEKELVPQLGDKMTVWLRYVDDTFTILKESEIENVRNVLNSFHLKINFTHEIEIEKSLPFLDVMVSRNDDFSFTSSVYRKATDTNVYVHWKAHAPKIWKIGTLKGLFRRAFMVSSTDEHLKNEITYLKNIFTKINGYPKAVVENTLKCVREKIELEAAELSDGTSATIDISNDNPQAEELFHPHIILPYKGFMGENIIKKFKKNFIIFFASKNCTTFHFQGS